MKHTQNLLDSLHQIEKEYPNYYAELKKEYSKYNSFDNLSLDDYVKNIFESNKRSFFTICSKESFNALCSNNNWLTSIIYSPLNDHSRPFMHKGDIVFCYRQGQFSELIEALQMRGIYGVGFVASEPQILFPEKEGHNQYGVAIIFPFGLGKHLELRNIQLNPITISLTPYNGNRNDALQYISDEKYYKSLISQIIAKNNYLKRSFETVLNQKIEDVILGDDKWKISMSPFDASRLYQESPYTQNSSQTIYFGVPGSGKSHRIDEKVKSLPDEQKIRVVFHPEYTNADFVGQVMPTMNNDGHVDYKFIPGPFAKILRRAYLHPSTKYYLIIEEINRGNASAIFGDLFQLLDRYKNGESEIANSFTYNEGWSNYSINNDFINWYFRENLYQEDDDKKLINKNDGIATKAQEESEQRCKAIEIGALHFSSNTGIRLPPNLSLLATMNTSDQNVFTLDNAFQRRWDMRLIENKFNDKDKNGNPIKQIIDQENAEISIKLENSNQSITWKDFQSQINVIIGEQSNESGLSSMEDKRLGCWFVKAENGVIKTDNFKNKVLKYLWDDAFKFCRNEVFEGSVKNFEELQKEFDKNGFKIFNANCNLKYDTTNENKDTSSVDSTSSTTESSTPEA